MELSLAKRHSLLGAMRSYRLSTLNRRVMTASVRLEGKHPMPTAGSVGQERYISRSRLTMTMGSLQGELRGPQELP